MLASGFGYSGAYQRMLSFASGFGRTYNFTSYLMGVRLSGTIINVNARPNGTNYTVKVASQNLAFTEIFYEFIDGMLEKLEGTRLEHSGERIYSVFVPCEQKSNNQQSNGGAPYYEDPLFYINSTLGAAGVGLAVKGEMWKTNELWHIQKNGKVRFAWDPKRNNHFIKQSRLNSLNKTAGLRSFSNKVAVASLAVTGYNIISTGEIKPSDMLNATMAGISFTGVGSLVSGTYFIVDFGFTIFTGEGLGQRLDRTVGSSVQLW